MTQRKEPVKYTCKQCGFIGSTTASTIPTYCILCKTIRDSTRRSRQNTRLRSHTKERRKHLQPENCMYCLTEFMPYRPNQVFCSSKCQRHARQDEEHFNGLRRTTIGLEEGLCWICRKVKVKHLHSHHLLGHKEAPEPLVGLCPGCHQLVEMLAARNFLADEQAIEDLITLARFRRNLPDRHTVVKLLEEK